jgi:hypothetical protein
MAMPVNREACPPRRAGRSGSRSPRRYAPRGYNFIGWRWPRVLSGRACLACPARPVHFIAMCARVVTSGIFRPQVTNLIMTETQP